MQFGVLGPLQVMVDGTDEPIVVSAVRLRVLLAVLLWRVNQPVPVDELAEMVWDGAPPAAVAEAVRALVMRLRRVLGERAAARIVTRAPGYVIELSGDELDASRFETLSRAAGAAVCAHRWPEAADTAAGALGLWRGIPLADISSQLLRDQWVPPLEQMRVQTLEWRIEADLHQGRHEQLIPELRKITGRYPLRERFHAQSMLALARAGRQAEALAAYQDARRVLVDELAIEPGPELRRLHERILAGDADLLTPSPAAGPVRAAATIPRQLPAAVRSFVGRRDELSMLSGLAEQAAEHAGAGDTVVISAIDGMAGVGKTALAIHAAHRLVEKFPDGQLFIDMHGYTQGYEPRPPGEALDRCLRALGVPPQQIPQDTEERAALFRQRLAGTRTLIVLDNAADETQVRPLLPGNAGCLVLVTSRRRLKGLDDAHVLAVDVLLEADAVALLRAVAGPGRVQGDDPVMAEIAGLCGLLPLALRIAAALLRHRPAWSAEHLAGLLRDQCQRIGALSDGERDLGAVFDLSYQSLPGAHQQLFRRLGLIPGPDFDAYPAAALTGIDPATATRMLEDLLDHNLLIQHAPGRYRLHDLIRLHARTLVGHDPVSDSADALGRLLDYYQHTAVRADALIARCCPATPAGRVPAHAPALPDADTAWAWLRAEHSNLLAILQHTTTHGHREYTIALTAGLATLLHVDGPWAQAIALHTVAAATAHSLGDQTGRADALNRLGNIRALTSDFREAARDLEQALHLYRDLGRQSGQAEVLTRLGEIRRVTGDLPEAARDLEQALHLYRDLGRQSGQADTLIQLGDMRRAAGDLPEAARDLEQALHLYRDLGHQSGQADVLTRLGDMRRVTGDLPEAARDLEQALHLYRDLGRRLGQANALARLGDVRRAAGDLPGAARDLEQALHLYRDLGHQLGQANARTFLGQVRLSEGDHPDAARHLEAAVDLFRRIGALGNEAWALNHYAAVIAATGDFTHANALFEDALRLAREAYHPDDEALALEGIGKYHLHTGDIQVGAAYLRQALDIFERLALKPDAERVHTRLAQLLSPSPSAKAASFTKNLSWVEAKGRGGNSHRDRNLAIPADHGTDLNVTHVFYCIIAEMVAAQVHAGRGDGANCLLGR